MSEKDLEKNNQPAPAGEETKQTDQTAPIDPLPSTGIDYEAEATKLQKKLDKAGNTIEKLKKSNKSSNDDDNDFIDMDAEIKKQVDEKTSAIRADLAADTLESTLDSLSANPDERKLIGLHYENSIAKSGFTRDAIRSDLEKAKVLANQNTIERQNEELSASLAAKDTVGNTSRGANLDKANIQRPEKPVSEMTREEHKAHWEKRNGQ
jgi:hypothetical protein